MLDNFLVAFEDDSDALIPYAVSTAKALGALATGVWPRRETPALEVGATIAAQALYPDEDAAPSRDGLPRFARAFDFAMVQQREPGRAPGGDDLTAALLAESGRPVWVVPAIQREPAKFARVLVAWDGGAAAAEAFSESKRILEHAGRVEIVSVTGASTRSAVIEGGERLAARIKRAGVPAEFRRLPGDEDPANTLLSYAADVGADLMVCGGYSHSRLRETLFGGATRTFLTSMTLPVFFAR